MNRTILTVLGLVLAWMAQAQGPPARVSPFTVEKSTRFSEIPAPMQFLDPAEYHSGAAGSVGDIHLHFTNVKAGKFKRGTLTVMLHEKTITSVTAFASSRRAVDKLLEQMTEQFGEPYKLQSHHHRYYITWLSGRESKYRITFESKEDFTDATVTIDKQ